MTTSSRTSRMLRPSLWSVLASLLLAASLSGCRNQTRVIVPNRVLDRPLDVVLTCVNVDADTGDITPTSLDQCDNPDRISCFDSGNQLLGFVANSERNEVAVVRRCDATAAVVDLDTNTPGYQLVSVGQLPSEVDATTLGCRVVTANSGSCDLTVLDGLGLARMSLAGEDAIEVAPSSLVSRLVPLRSDGEPLGARPGALLVAPDDLSQAALEVGGGSDGFEDEGDSCEADAIASAWVTFPTCQLLAEVDLISGQILQSRRFLAQDDGSVVVEDTGTTPVCPVDCPVQFSEGVPPTCSGAEEDPANCRPRSDPEGFFPSTVELVRPPVAPEDDDVPFAAEASSAANYSALFVGGTGSDSIIELQFEQGSMGEEVAVWSDNVLSLPLENPRGIQKIRGAPALEMVDGPHQFLYVIAGDGTTHVVDRNFGSDVLGVECDTQVDPTTLPTPFPSCNPIDPTVGGSTAPDRRPFAVGPGIRVSGGAGFTDWTFLPTNGNAQSTEGEIATSGAPFGSPGIVGVGTTSFGRIVLAAFNQLQSGTVLRENVDPVGIMDLSVPPHSLWPLVDPTQASSDNTEPLPRVDDDVPTRVLAADEFSSQALSPTLRRVDAAYALPDDPDAFSEERISRALALGSIDNTDALGGFEGEGVYENEVVRAIVRDYQQWFPTAWTLAWEGNLPGTRSSTGRIECDTPGWENGTCIRSADSPSEAVRLVDDSAGFCDDGVLAGDKIVILGCASDDDCGLGQRCLQDPTAPSSATGICISAQAFEQDFEVLRQVCAPFISEACGRPRREYIITRAFQNELHIEAIDRPEESHLRVVDPETGERPEDGEELVELGLEENIARYTCELPAEEGVVVQPEGGAGCTNDDQCTMLNGGDTPYLCAPDGFCRGPCPGGDPTCLECEADADCDHFGDGALCVNFQCQRPCEPGQRDCVQALLPGPRCFSEFVDYVVRTHNSFTVVGSPVPDFITDRVVIDAETGECVEDTSQSSLLTSRLRLARDEESVFSDPFIGIPDCPNPDEAAPSDPNPCRITQLRSESPATRYHRMEYEGEPVEAIRFSNPNISLIIDLADLLTLSSDVEVTDGNGDIYVTRFPTELRRFQRARIPRNYAETFNSTVGYIPVSEQIFIGSTVGVFPVQVIPGPSRSNIDDSESLPSTVYIVDAGGRGGPAGVRGQVLRVLTPAITSGGFVDNTFLVR